MKVFFLCAVVIASVGCNSQYRASDSKSNWLRACGSARDCGQGLSCSCGVCTKACASAAVCDDRAGQASVCVDPSARGLDAVCQLKPTVAVRSVCLQSCVETADCAEQQRCMRGLCLNQALLDASIDAGTGDDAGQSPPPGKQSSDGGPVPMDGGRRSDAGGHTTPIPRVIDPSDDRDGGATSACGDCPVGLVCHVDDSCIAPGVPDAHGIATLTSPFPESAVLITADTNFVYGINQSSDGGAVLMRWPASGGDGQALAQAAVFWFLRPWSSGASIPLVADADRLYFLAAASANELSASLFSMPKDDSAPPTAHGIAGSWLVQDATDLYLSNDGDSRIVRVQKSALVDSTPARTPVFTTSSDGPNTVQGLAINSASVFIAEVPPGVQDSVSPMFTIVRFDKASGGASALATNDKFSARFLSETFADDSYFVLGGSDDATNRMDLVTLEVKPLPGSESVTLNEHRLYAAFRDALTSNVAGGFWYVDLASARRTFLLQDYSRRVLSVVVGSGSLYAVTVLDDSTGRALLRLPVP